MATLNATCAYIKIIVTIGPSSPKSLSITREFQNGIELNWLPPIEPNGEVHYVIYYTPEGGTEQSIDTGSDLTHYNLTGLERNRVYTNISVQAVNSVGRSIRNAVIEDDNQIPPGGSCMVKHSYYVNTVLYIYNILLLYFAYIDTGSPSLPGPSSTTGNELLHACCVLTALIIYCT